YEVFSFFTWPSIVVPPICGDGTSASFGGAAASSPVFIPSLTPLTAPPRSCPMLRSFFVPKISTTTSRTISQCHMLNPPIVFSSESSARAPREHRAQRVRAADDVNVDVHHVLPADAAGVEHPAGP